MVSDIEFQNLKKRVEKLEKEVFSKNFNSKKSGKKSIMVFLIKLRDDGFFDQPKSVKEILAKLAEDAYHYPASSLTEPLQRAIRNRILGRIKKDKVWTYVKR